MSEIALHNRMSARDGGAQPILLIVLVCSMIGLAELLCVGARPAPQLSNFHQATPQAKMQYLGARVGANVKKDAAKTYHARMRRAFDYIDERLHEDLCVDVLSDVAAFSKYHFHRQFSELFGISVHRYIQLMRLRRASHRLAFRRDDPVMQIALDAGYNGPEAFSRAFKQRMGQTPSAFRKQPQWTLWHAACRPINEARSAHMKSGFTDDQVRIIDFPATSIAILEHRGDPALIGDSIRRFIAWRRGAGLPPKNSATFNILHADPESTAPEDYGLDLCAATERPIPSNDEGVGSGTIPAGRCAVLRMIGSSDNLRPAVSFLYADWLPRSGEELRDFPIYAQRVSFFPDVAESEAITDIFLPLRDQETKKEARSSLSGSSTL